jgi:glycosyltransferase involved in cell wall biosynthesis
MKKRVVVVANDHVGSSMAGPGIRCVRFAEELSRTYDVTLSVPFATDYAPTGYELVQQDSWDARSMTRLTRGAHAVVSQRLPVETMRALARSRTRAIYDLYAPVTIEDLAQGTTAQFSRQRGSAYRLNAIVQQIALATGSAFICASERQRDFWLGWLAAAGRLTRDAYAHDPSLRTLIDIVPFGIDREPPRATEPVLKGVIDGIRTDDRVLLWGGGIWNWFDAQTVIRAVAELARERDDVKLFFLGLAHPNPHVPVMGEQTRALALTDELGLTGRSIFFNDSWVPHADRGAYLLEADIGVSAHRDEVETRLAFRTRLLDYFWAGLPVVTTRGDSLADEVARRGLGRVVDYGDVQGWVAALTELLDDPQAHERASAASAAIREEFAWPRVVAPVRTLIESDSPPPPSPRHNAVWRSYLSARLENAIVQHGAGGALRRSVARIRPGS